MTLSDQVNVYKTDAPVHKAAPLNHDERKASPINTLQLETPRYSCAWPKNTSPNLRVVRTILSLERLNHRIN